MTNSESGFGLVELLIAMTIMAVGISAIVAGFSSGIIALNRASHTSTAGTLADRQMEAYRALQYTSVALNTVTGAASPYTTDRPTGSTLGNDVVDGAQAACPVTTPSPWTPAPSCAVQSGVVGPDGRTYRVDSYIIWYCPLGASAPTPAAAPTTCGAAARPVKQVTVVVRDVNGTPANKILFRETSTFDSAT
jgi:prepilin-type N-terminal cleavage/methylation domain-containing protein